MKLRGRYSRGAPAPVVVVSAEDARKRLWLLRVAGVALALAIIIVTLLVWQLYSFRSARNRQIHDLACTIDSLTVPGSVADLTLVKAYHCGSPHRPATAPSTTVTRTVPRSTPAAAGGPVRTPPAGGGSAGTTTTVVEPGQPTVTDTETATRTRSVTRTQTTTTTRVGIPLPTLPTIGLPPPLCSPFGLPIC